MNTALALVVLLMMPSAALGARIAFSDVFPAKGPHRAALDRDGLDRPLVERISAWKRRTGKRSFRKKIVVYKANRRLDVYAGDEVIKSYVVNLGGDPVHAKRVQGDAATPEGSMFVCAHNRKSAYHRFLGLAYPTVADAQRGVRTKLVKPAVLAATRAAYLHHDRCPPQTTKLGGAVGIHGSGDWRREGDTIVLTDWTLGCIGMRSADVDELFDSYARVGTPVEIFAAQPSPNR